MQLCPHGAGFNPIGEDVDDCKVLPGLCAHGTCINTLGSYRCACNHGYEPNRSKQVCLGELKIAKSDVINAMHFYRCQRMCEDSISL